MSNPNNSVKLLIACLALVAFAASCGQPAPAPDTRAADEAAIMSADMVWAEAAGSKQVDAALSHMADDAMMFPPNQPLVQGRENLRQTWEALFSLPGFALSWSATRAVAARSGDLGYSYGTYEFTVADPEGNPVTDKGKYVTVWTKQDDGSWKVTADIFNSSLPLSEPTE